MIILLNGPIGVGKTTTARWLVSRVEGSALIDGELLTQINPFDHRSLDHFSFGCQTIRTLMDHYGRRGYSTFCLTWVIETRAHLAHLIDILRLDSHQEIRSFVLQCGYKELLRRIRGRGRPNLGHELVRGRELHGVFCRKDLREYIGTPINTSLLTAEQAAMLILQSVGPNDANIMD